MQVSLGTKSLAGSRVNVVGPPLTVAVWVPLDPQEMEYQLPVTSTASLNVMLTFASTATLACPPVGLVVVTSGGWSPRVIWCAPSPSTVSVANPFHSVAGSKASAPFGSPAWIVDLRRRVLSAVLVSPVPHSVPGSRPICPITSSTVVPLRRTTASSPLNQPAPFVWSAWARIAAFAELCATTNTSSLATVPVRLMVSPAVVLPLKNI